MDRRDILRRNLDRVIWNIERARVSVSEHHIVKIVAISKYSDESSIEEYIDWVREPLERIRFNSLRRGYMP